MVLLQSLSPAAAAKLLEKDETLQLVDIRTKAEMKEGSPDLRSFKKSLITSTYQPSAAPPKASGSQSSTVTIGWPERLCKVPKVQLDSPLSMMFLDSQSPQGCLPSPELE